MNNTLFLSLVMAHIILYTAFNFGNSLVYKTCQYPHKVNLREVSSW